MILGFVDYVGFFEVVGGVGGKNMLSHFRVG